MTIKEFENVICWGYSKITTKGKDRRDGSSANTHPGRVVVILKRAKLIHYNKEKQDYLYSIVAFFHDMIEDGEATYEEIAEIAGKEVADAVQILSKDPELQEQEGYMDIYISRIAQNELTRLVKVADRIENVTSFKGLKNKKEYLEETERWIVPLAKGTILEEALNEAVRGLRAEVENEEKLKVKVGGDLR